MEGCQQLLHLRLSLCRNINGVGIDR